MTEIERMRQYVERTSIPKGIRHGLLVPESFELCGMYEDGSLDAFSLAFDYGYAKGYCMAMAAIRK